MLTVTRIGLVVSLVLSGACGGSEVLIPGESSGKVGAGGSTGVGQTGPGSTGNVTVGPSGQSGVGGAGVGPGGVGGAGAAPPTSGDAGGAGAAPPGVGGVGGGPQPAGGGPVGVGPSGPSGPSGQSGAGGAPPFTGGTGGEGGGIPVPPDSTGFAVTTVGGGGSCDNQGSCENCQSCAWLGPCSPQATACDQSTECSAILACFSGCAADDEQCTNKCYFGHPQGHPAYNALLICIACQQCSNDCDASQNGCPPGL